MICDDCSKLPSCAGQAYTKYICQICGKNKIHHNNKTPKICKECSDELQLCQRCCK